MSSANSEFYLFFYQSGFLLFLFLFWLIWLKLSKLCWIVVVRMHRLVLFLTFRKCFQFFTTEDNVCCGFIKMGQRIKQIFLQRRHTDGKHKKRCSTSLIIREMQIKTTVRYHLIAVRMAVIKRLQTINAGEGAEKREPSYIVGGSAN